VNEGEMTIIDFDIPISLIIEQTRLFGAVFLNLVMNRSEFVLESLSL
jgi:hypothetical protein